MRKNRTLQLLWQTVYCVLALIGILCSIGYFDRAFNRNFFVYYTNLSNYICAGIMLVSLVQSYRKVRRGEDGFCTTAPVLTFCSMILILITFLVYTFILSDYTPLEYFTTLSNVLLHCLLPLLFFFHWLLFYEHGNMRWYHPLCCIIMPAVYVLFIVIRAPIAKGNPGMDVWPYFFLDMDALGVGGFFRWIGILFVAFMGMTYIFYGLDKLWKRFRKKD